MSKAIVVGAGMVGLSTAWYLQEYGYHVTILDRMAVAAGSSWGNAGWLSPGKAIPLADSSLWKSGPKALLDPDAALHVPPRFDPALWSFIARFMAHGNQRRWDKAMAALTPIDQRALESFDELSAGGVDFWTQTGSFVVAFGNESESQGFQREVAGAVRHGQQVPIQRLDNPQQLSAQLSEAAHVGFQLDGQRFIEPGPYVEALSRSVVARGADLREGVAVSSVADNGEPTVHLRTGESLTADKVVLATGALLPHLARPLGVKVRVQAGRGYSFTVETDQPVERPIYLPVQRLACTPYQGRLRIAGTMEFRRPDEPFQPRRVEAMVKQAKTLLTGVDLENRQDEWVGSRPVTPDGKPLVGQTKMPDVYVAGGHGMWGIVLGPITGKLLAQQIATGVTDSALRPFDPLR